MDLRQKIEDLIAPFLSQIDAFIIDIHIVPGGQRKVVQIFVDTDSGITIDQCVEMNRRLGAVLELQDAITDSYILQVSSPGLEKPLKLMRQYRKNIGRQFRVRFRRDDGFAEISAKLASVENEILTFTTSKKETYAIPFNEIIESIEELPW